jgi:hypothetical protein
MAEGETRYDTEMPKNRIQLWAWCDVCTEFSRFAEIDEDEEDGPLIYDFQLTASRHEVDDQGNPNGHHAHYQIKRFGAYDTTRSA